MTARCTKALIEFMDLTSHINVYDVYGTCWGSTAETSDKFKLYEA